MKIFVKSGLWNIEVVHILLRHSSWDINEIWTPSFYLKICTLRIVHSTRTWKTFPIKNSFLIRKSSFPHLYTLLLWSTQPNTTEICVKKFIFVITWLDQIHENQFPFVVIHCFIFTSERFSNMLLLNMTGWVDH